MDEDHEIREEDLPEVVPRIVAQWLRDAYGPEVLELLAGHSDAGFSAALAARSGESADELARMMELYVDAKGFADALYAFAFRIAGDSERMRPLLTYVLDADRFGEVARLVREMYTQGLVSMFVSMFAGDGDADEGDD